MYEVRNLSTSRKDQKCYPNDTFKGFPGNIYQVNLKEKNKNKDQI